MKFYAPFLLALFITLYSCQNQKETKPFEKTPEYVLVIHGGAGTILKENMTPEIEEEHYLALQKALSAGENVLKENGTAMGAVMMAVMSMEDSPLFNAGKGSVFNENGVNEMDASVMDGESLKAGAVAGVHTIKNPVLAAYAVMTETQHVMLIGEGAEKFADEQELTIEKPSYFFTENRWQAYLKAKENAENRKDEKFETVGAVALDLHGNLAAATSTGGRTYKMEGRVGDSPIIGAGTYAENETCAISATGHGEFFIRNAVAYDISALMKYKGYTLQQAADSVIMMKLKNQGAAGGIIAVDKDGHFTMTFNTPGMYRAYINSFGEMEILIYGKE
jgi:beta-aspartyl-peptidase (threonine type)